jgi:trk system potassium uptake protein TrkH
MNYKLVAYLLGKLCITLAGALAIPLLLSLVWGESCWTAFAISIALSLIIGKGLDVYGEADAKDTMTFREGVAVTAGTWILLTWIGGQPFYFAGILDQASCLFESISGFTTTGSTAIASLGDCPMSILFWRAFTHWMGGIGIVVWFIALLPNLSGSIVHAYNAEVTGAVDDRVLPRIRETTIALVRIYIVFTAVETVLLVFAGMNLFDAITHSFSTIGTGGFSNYDDSVMHFNSVPIEMILSFFMLLAGGNFALYYAVWRKGIRELWKDTEFVSFWAIVAVTTLLITLNLYAKMSMSIWESLRYSLFTVASVISTTGFASVDFDLWPTFSKLILVLLMFVGSCAGSTAGGIKVSRVCVLCKTALADARRVLHPNAVSTVKMNGEPVPDNIVSAILRFFFLFMALFAFLVLLVAMTGLTVTDAISAVACTIGNVGPDFGVVGPTQTFAPMHPFAKIVLCVSMLLGRLELFTLMIMLRPEFWRGTRKW